MEGQSQQELKGRLKKGKDEKEPKSEPRGQVKEVERCQKKETDTCIYRSSFTHRDAQREMCVRMHEERGREKYGRCKEQCITQKEHRGAVLGDFNSDIQPEK